MAQGDKVFSYTQCFGSGDVDLVADPFKRRWNCSDGRISALMIQVQAVFSRNCVRPRLITPLSWSSLGVLVAINFIWLSVSPLEFATSNFTGVGTIGLAFVLSYCVFRLVSYRLNEDRSIIANAIRAVVDRVNLLMWAFGFTIFLGLAGFTYTSLVIAAVPPLQDARLAALDQILGFDWLWFLALTNSSPSISWVLVAAYSSTGLQVAIALSPIEL